MAPSLTSLSSVIASRMPEVVQRPSQEATRQQNLRTTWLALFSWLSGAIAAMVIHAWSGDNRPEMFHVVSASLTIAAASSSVGMLLGFLFGIPRSLQDGAPNPSASAGADNARSKLRVNTNLEQISDWLTKILVGVGLTQLREIGPRMWALAGSLAVAMGGNTPVALGVVVNFSIWGFFVGYLLTRLFLATAFSLADDATEQLIKQEVVAFSLTEKGAHTTAAAQYTGALDQITPETPADQRQRIFEGAIYNSLYLPAPDGYLQAQKYASQYIADTTNPPSARIWAYLAAAYGQEYTQRRVDGAPQSELKDTRGKALTAVREALRLDSRLKSLLRMMWDPSDPTKASLEEDDLEVFHDDTDFKKVLE
jgi:hypothetical protein